MLTQQQEGQLANFEQSLRQVQTDAANRLAEIAREEAHSREIVRALRFSERNARAMAAFRHLVENIVNDRNAIMHEQEDLYNYLKELERNERYKPAQPQTEPLQRSPIPSHGASENSIMAALPHRRTPPQPTLKRLRQERQPSEPFQAEREYLPPMRPPPPPPSYKIPRATHTASPVPIEREYIPLESRNLIEFDTDVPTTTVPQPEPVRQLFRDIPAAIPPPPHQGRRRPRERGYIPPSFTGVPNMPTVLPRQAEPPEKPEQQQGTAGSAEAGIQTISGAAPVYQFLDKDKNKGILKPITQEKLFELSRPQRVIKFQHILPPNRYKRKPHVIRSR